jgi:TonB-linked SusC/RagA family outer membrane protein
MYKIFTKILCGLCPAILKLRLPGRTIIAALIIALVNIAPNANAQNLNLKKRNISFDEIFKEIKKQTGYDVVFISSRIKSDTRTEVSFAQTPLKQVLDGLLSPRGLEYTIQKNTIVIRERSTEPVPVKKPGAGTQVNINIQGTVVDEQNDPLIGATITLKGTDRTATTDRKGQFSFFNVTAESTFIFSFIGYTTREVKLLPAQTNIALRMQETLSNLTEIVVTGTGINRKRESFTGASETFSGAQLKEIGNRNVIESLKTLDPAFITLENNLQGSNPNSMPNIEIRGKTTITNSNLNDQYSANPNQPLFILDGFESSLQVIYDLDMNRVASITLLKDAASTALYGAKAANGVVVVETKKPIPGQLKVSYTSDLSLDIPDLSSYNLMNAAEKLQFEKLSGVYYTPNADQWKTDSIYNGKMAAIASGVNSYWLSSPVTTGITQRHSIQMTGGSNELLFQAGLNYRDQNGVMKGSFRDTWGGQIALTYRKKRVNVTNMLTVNNLKTNESPYGAFSNFAGANPYYPKTNADGTISPFLDPGINVSSNPLYNAGLKNINQSKSFGITDNLQAIYTFSNNFRAQGGVSLSKNNTDGVNFLPPDNTIFAGTAPNLKGNYTNAISNYNSYGAYLMTSYARVIGKHQFTANIRGDIQSNTSTNSTFQAVGFPFGTDGNPAFAFGYPAGGRPLATTNTLHTTAILASINYAYNERYLLDATYRLDGASTFGSNNLYQPFFAVGLGWNIHKEDFLESAHWINILKLRANIGYTGNENLGQFTSTSVYTFLSGVNTFGQGLNLSSLGNPNLDWQNTLQKSCGIDFDFFKGRINGYIEYFDKHTDPLAIVANGALPSSVGINSNYVLNIGYLNTRGYDFNLRISPIYDLTNRIIWSVGITGQQTASRYGGIGNSLSALNTKEQNNNSLMRYQDGFSPDDIWAVKSRGIDPATGSEIFEKKDGTLTFTYNPADIVQAGNTQPSLQGVLSTNITYKNFSAGVYVRYSLGGAVFNTALYSKVENISSANLIYNQDKRALYDRWQNPGDVSQFKAISLRSTTPMSSRFVEKDNHFNGESFNLSYRFAGQWLKKYGLQTLNLTGYANNIFRIESILSERGLSYPYARSVSFSLNASF